MKRRQLERLSFLFFLSFFLPSSAPLRSSGVILAISCDKVTSRAGGGGRIYSPTLRSTSGRGGQGQGDGAGVQARGGAGGSVRVKAALCVEAAVEAGRRDLRGKRKDISALKSRTLVGNFFPSSDAF